MPCQIEFCYVGGLVADQAELGIISDQRLLLEMALG